MFVKRILFSSFRSYFCSISNFILLTVKISFICIRSSISACGQIKEFQAWQETWRKTNLEDIEMKKKMGEKKRLEAEEKIKADIVEVAATPTRPAVRSL